MFAHKRERPDVNTGDRSREVKRHDIDTGDRSTEVKKRAHLLRSSLRSMVLPPLPVTGRVSRKRVLVPATCHPPKQSSSTVNSRKILNIQ